MTSSARPLPLQELSVVDAFGTDPRAAGFDASGVPALLGATAQSALPRTGINAALESGILERDRSGVRALLDVRPHADDDADFLVVSDPDSDTRPGPVNPDHVLGIGVASVSLARAVIRRPVARALDLGTGCGIQALHLNSHADEIVGTDTNPRALALAAATARLNGMSWDLRAGSLFEPVAGGTIRSDRVQPAVRDRRRRAAVLLPRLRHDRRQRLRADRAGGPGASESWRQRPATGQLAGRRR